MRAVDELVKEHDAILLVVDAAKAEAARIAKSGKVNCKRVRAMVDFFQNFVDRCHHGKEEKCLFPALEARGVPRYMGPVGCMLREHELGRGEVGGIVRALDAFEKGRSSAATRVAEHLAWYADLLTAHIQRENEVLFRLGDTVLSKDDQAELAKGFEAAEREEMGPCEYDRYRTWARKLNAAKRPSRRVRTAN